MIRRVKLEDANKIVEIYNHYILNSTVTFEETPIDVLEIKNRIQSITPNFPWIVYESEGQILGYAYANKWKPRHAYKNTVESTIYLKRNETKRGIGSILLGELIKLLADMNFHAVIGGIALPNKPSVRLHEKLGFEKAAHFKEIGFKFEKWIDVEYWELIIENFRET